MGNVRNVLFIMCDQLRADYLSCYGHPTLETPNIDYLAQQGVKFNRAFIQSPSCGPSRMSFYTGRYVASHGAFWNFVPLRPGEHTLGDHLKQMCLTVAVAGKTHITPNTADLQRLGIDPQSEEGRFYREGGFEPYDRDDGTHLAPPGIAINNNYAEYLRDKGYVDDNPWLTYANSAEDGDGTILSGMEMRHARLPARVREEHSETPYMTDRAIDYIRSKKEEPWCLHLSYIKPHWPYVAPAPYNDMYDTGSILDANRGKFDTGDLHPVIEAYQKLRVSQSFRPEAARQTIIPTYMGLTKQVDDHLGRLWECLRQLGRMEDTLIIFTSDHGDYLGDHYLGDKEFFHEESVRIPLIVYDPSPEADSTRGTETDALVESIDILPTILEGLGGDVPGHILEGRSLVPVIRGGQNGDWRTSVLSEFDYSFLAVRNWLGMPVDRCRMYMIRTAEWKYIFMEDFPPILFNLTEDPRETVDVSGDPKNSRILSELNGQLFERLRTLRYRPTLPDSVLEDWREDKMNPGLKIGAW